MQTHEYVITMDVGGTKIKAAAIGADSSIIKLTMSIYSSKSSSSKQVILNNFGTIINDIVKKMEWGFKCLGICFAFPGPFDYDNGICYISGVGKYENLYGVNIREEIVKIILNRFKDDFVDGFKIYFENDARLFALGEYTNRCFGNYNRVMFVTLGTGVGSAFVENGKILQNDSRIPAGGYIYNTKYESETIEDKLSSRGILKLARQRGLTTFESVKDLADAAKDGNHEAIELFSEYGRLLGSALKSFLKDFGADALVIGGQISRSSDLFLDELKQSLEDLQVDVCVSEESYISTFFGAYTYFMENYLKRG